MLDHFGPFGVIFGPLWDILGHFWAISWKVQIFLRPVGVMGLAFRMYAIGSPNLNLLFWKVVVIVATKLGGFQESLSMIRFLQKISMLSL